MATAPPAPPSPYDAIGGRDAIAALVKRFYALMTSDPAYGALKAMHGTELASMHEKLTDYISAWMGGPRDWFDKNPGVAIMAVHGAMPDLDSTAARQWIDCMTAAAAPLAEKHPDAIERMLAGLASMCRTMAQRAEAGWQPHAH